MNQRIPSQTCAFCDKSISEIGGSRIILNPMIGVLIETEDKPLTHIKNVTKKVDLGDHCSLLFVQNLWNEVSIERAIQQAREGTHPWVCQICGRRACPTCGGPGLLAIASEVIYDNGDTAHCGILPVGDLTCGKCRK